MFVNRAKEKTYFFSWDASSFSSVFGCFIAIVCLQSNISPKKSNAQNPHASAQAQFKSAPTGIAAAKNKADIIVKIICRYNNVTTSNIYIVSRARARSQEKIARIFLKKFGNNLKNK
jgi:hypothetical protein